MVRASMCSEDSCVDAARVSIYHEERQPAIPAGCSINLVSSTYEYSIRLYLEELLHCVL